MLLILLQWSPLELGFPSWLPPFQSLDSLLDTSSATNKPTKGNPCKVSKWVLTSISFIHHSLIMAGEGTSGGARGPGVSRNQIWDSRSVQNLCSHPSNISPALLRS